MNKLIKQILLSVMCFIPISYSMESDIHNRNFAGGKPCAPLVEFVKEGYSDLASNLLNTGDLKINDRDDQGTTPVMQAIENIREHEEAGDSSSANKSYEMLKMLLQHEPDLSIENNNGNTAMSIAERYDLGNVLELLNKYDNSNNSAVRSQSLETMQIEEDDYEAGFESYQSLLKSGIEVGEGKVDIASDGNGSNGSHDMETEITENESGLGQVDHYEKPIELMECTKKPLRSKDKEKPKKRSSKPIKKIEKSKPKSKAKFKCDLCPNATFCYSSGLAKHKMLHHLDQANCGCTIKGCGKRFFAASRIFDHFTREHKGHKPAVLCLICHKEFSKLKKGYCEHIDNKPSEYSCEHDGCKKTFPTIKKRNRHMNTHTDVREYKCTHSGCSASFKVPSALIAHGNTHKADKPWACSEEGCEASFKSKGELSDHSKRHIKKFACDESGCNERFTNKRLLQGHKIDSHTAIETIHRCPYCNHKATSAGSLNSHKMKEHQDQAEFKCSVESCPNKYFDQSGLTRHMHSKHPDLDPRKCNDCNKNFKTVTECENHKKRIHGTSKDYICDEGECHKSFSCEQDLRSHKLIAHTIDPQICDECGKELQNKYKLTDHKKKCHSEEIFVCGVPECNSEPFQTQSNLKRHIDAVHLGLRPDRVPCIYPDCTNDFYNKQALNQHISTYHKGEVNYECGYCGDRFRSLEWKKKHMLWTCLDRPNIGQKTPCDIEGCTEKFLTFNAFRKHKREGHKE